MKRIPNDKPILEHYRITIQQQHSAFPKVLRFYWQDPKTRRIYIHSLSESFNNPLPDEITFALHNAKLNGVLSEEQDYQVNTFIKNNNSGVINMGTGKGKSWVIMATVLQKKCRTLILTHNIKTCNEMYASFMKHTDIPAEYVGCINSQSDHPQTGIIDIITHTSFKKYYNTPQYLRKYDMILYDECDYNLSFPKQQNYDCMLGAIIVSNPRYLYGFTGTPYRAEGGEEALTRIYGQISTYENNTPKYHYIPAIYQISYPYDGDYSFSNWAELMDELKTNENRTDEQVRFINQNKRKWNMVLVKSVYESEMLHEKLPGSILMNGTQRKDEDKAASEAVDLAIKQDNGFMIVGTIDKMGRGVDIPPTDTLFLFSPVKFQGTVVQAVGRALRKYPGKNDVKLFDWCDTPLLIKQKRERAKAYKQEYGIKEIIDKNI